MTFREWMKKNRPQDVDEECNGGCYGCPSEYFDIQDKCHKNCRDCWGREIPKGVRPREEAGRKEQRS